MGKAGVGGWSMATKHILHMLTAAEIKVKLAWRDGQPPVMLSANVGSYLCLSYERREATAACFQDENDWAGWKGWVNKLNGNCCFFFDDNMKCYVTNDTLLATS